MPGDPLTAKAVALGPTFAWINHTWDHAELGRAQLCAGHRRVHPQRSIPARAGAGPYATANAVTPNISGLASADAMLAIRDVGITQLVSDTSQPGQDNPSPNVGIPNAFQPTVLEVPRIASELYYNVSQPSEWIPEYEALRSPTAAVDYGTIIGTESDAFLQYLLNGNNDPWMFHQANARDYDGAGHSLLTDLMDATLQKYGAVATFPVVSPNMDELAGRVRNRMALNASGVRGDGSGGHLADGLRQQRGDGPGHRALHAGRRDVRWSDDLVPGARGRAINDAVAHRLQPGYGWSGRRRRLCGGRRSGRQRNDLRQRGRGRCHGRRRPGRCVGPRRHDRRVPARAVRRASPA